MASPGKDHIKIPSVFSTECVSLSHGREVKVLSPTIVSQRLLVCEIFHLHRKVMVLSQVKKVERVQT